MYNRAKLIDDATVLAGSICSQLYKWVEPLPGQDASYLCKLELYLGLCTALQVTSAEDNKAGCSVPQACTHIACCKAKNDTMTTIQCVPGLVEQWLFIIRPGLADLTRKPSAGLLWIGPVGIYSGWQFQIGPQHNIHYDFTVEPP